MNGLWNSFPMLETLNHDLAIRRFCPARIEQERGELEEIVMSNYDHEVHHLQFVDSLLASTSEVDHQLVDSFINMNDRNQDHDQREEDDKNMFSMVNDHMGDGFAMNDMVELEQRQQKQNDGAGVDGVSDTEMVPCVINQGLQLVHLLLACAEAVCCKDTKLAESILGHIWVSANPWGDSLQRVSYCFAVGLKNRLLLLGHNNNNPNGANMGFGSPLMSTREEKIEAFHLFYQTTPYVAFGFMAANEAICQASQGKDVLHIVDLGMGHTLQWPSLLRSLASRPEGPPRIRITGLTDGNKGNLLKLKASMEILVADANLLGVNLELNMVSEHVTPSLFTKENLNLREEEALLVNSAMQLHKYVKESRGSLKAILQAIKKLNPILVTMVEQDANHNGPFFLRRFLESLHYYSAIFDSLEASLTRDSHQRMKIERIHLADEIRNIVACEGSDRVERHERADQWRRQFGRAGFQVVGMKCLSQARMMLSVYGCDGYTLASEKGCLCLGWKGRPIMIASAWQVHNVTSS